MHRALPWRLHELYPSIFFSEAFRAVWRTPGAEEAYLRTFSVSKEAVKQRAVKQRNLKKYLPNLPAVVSIKDYGRTRGYPFGGCYGIPSQKTFLPGVKFAVNDR